MAVFIFLSPQFVINHPNAPDFFIDCSHLTTLCLVALDNAHIHVQHRTSFYSKILELQAIFLAKPFGNQPNKMRP
jgi:hypothetical protein